MTNYDYSNFKDVESADELPDDMLVWHIRGSGATRATVHYRNDCNGLNGSKRKAEKMKVSEVSLRAKVCRYCRDEDSPFSGNSMKYVNKYRGALE